MNEETQEAPRKRKMSRGWIISLSAVAVLVTVAAVFSAMVAPQALSARGALKAAVPLAKQAKDQILAGESDEAKESVAQLTAQAAAAEAVTDTLVWDIAEMIPLLGENFRAVRIVAEAVSTLNSDVLQPATDVNLSALKPRDGAIDVQRMSALLPVVKQASLASAEVTEQLSAINTNSLLPELRDGVVELRGAVRELSAMTEPATAVLSILPAMLGADGPKNYLLMFPNNAEIRAGGGNPAALALITADNGRISITQQASSADFRRKNLPINPETVTLYDVRTRQMMQDATYTPYFWETAELMRGHWADSFSTPIDGVVSFDPVALSYLLAATGPVTLSTGDVLTAENAVPLLLSEVYSRYPDPAAQDAFFAAATQSIFSGILSGNADTRSLVDALARAAEEGRLMYSSDDEAQMKLIGATRIAGPLPPDNSQATVLGVFFNYVLAAKMDYYMDSAVSATTTQCQVSGSERATFSATTTVTNILTPEQARSLPAYVIASNGGSDIYRDVMFYGPVGTNVQSVTVDGEMVDPLGRWGNNYRELPHMGRPVVQVPIVVGMQETASVSVTFVAAANQDPDSFGPFEVRATPTVRTTPVEVSRPGC